MKGKQGKGGIGGQFRNSPRIDHLHLAILDGNRERMEGVINDRTMNAQASKRLKGKGAVWETLLEDSVWQVTDPTLSSEPVVVKLFDEMPFHEIGGNILATKLIETVGPFFVRCLDVGRFVDTAGNFFIVMEYVPDDPEGVLCNVTDITIIIILFIFF